VRGRGVWPTKRGEERGHPTTRKKLDKERNQKKITVNKEGDVLKHPAPPYKSEPKNHMPQEKSHKKLKRKKHTLSTHKSSNKGKCERKKVLCEKTPRRMLGRKKEQDR